MNAAATSVRLVPQGLDGMRYALAPLLELARRLDARWFQIAFLLSLLLFGALARDFALSPAQVALSFAGTVLTQTFWQHALRLPMRWRLSGYLSAIVTGCSISILVRSDVLWVHPLVACLAMSSKFVLRAGQGAQRGHMLNPANLACMAVLWLLPHAWLSPGQWGFETLAALWIALLGGVVSGRVARWGISLAFLLTWLGLLAARLLWLGVAPELALAQWLHQAQNGALLLFAFFMISDPMTTPQHARARLAYGVCVALSGFAWQYGMYRPHGMLVALFAWSWTVPVWNVLWPAQRFAWAAPGCVHAPASVPTTARVPAPEQPFVGAAANVRAWGRG